RPATPPGVGSARGTASRARSCAHRCLPLGVGVALARHRGRAVARRPSRRDGHRQRTAHRPLGLLHRAVSTTHLSTESVTMALKATPESQAALLSLQASDMRLQQLAHQTKTIPQLARLAELTLESERLRQQLL